MGLPIGTQPVLAVMVVNLDNAGKVCICAEIGGAYGIEPRHHAEVVVGMRPNAVELVIVNEKVNAML